jgi:hypothetical protein
MFCKFRECSRRFAALRLLDVDPLALVAHSLSCRLVALIGAVV